MLYLTRLVSLLLLFCYCSHVKQTQTASLQNAIPALHITTDTGSMDLKISKLAVDIKVTGNISTTTFDITFYNGLNKILEGELDFPLADGQTIVRYALDIDGRLREGVVVEKAKARVAFENTVRQGIDPGLVEKTAGNNFRTRVYPIPAKGYKRLAIAIEQKLQHGDEALLYQLPLEAADAIDTLSIKAVARAFSKPELLNNFFKSFKFQSIDEAYAGSYLQKSFSGSQVFSFSIPYSQEAAVAYTENKNGKTYFYINGRIDLVTERQRKPLVVGLLWDISGSADKRIMGKETALVTQYVSALGDVRVILIPFNIKALEPVEFRDKAALIAKLGSFDFDGGTQLGAIDLSKYGADEFLLFSDGLSTFGKKEMLLTSKRVHTITSSPSSDFSYLRFIAKETGGAFIDLSKIEAEAAVSSVTNSSAALSDVTVTEGSIESLVTELDPTKHSVSISGILTSATARFTLSVGPNGGTKTRIEYTVSATDQREAEGVARIWASMKINELDLRFEKNKDAITALGKEFSIVTQNTSLLVLDRVEDYVRYGIVPPAELQKEYFALLKDAQDEKIDSSKVAMEEAVREMNELKTWWNKKVVIKQKEKKPSANRDGDRIFYRISHQNVTTSSRANASSDSVLVYGNSPSPQRETQADSSTNYNFQTAPPTPSKAPPPPQLESAKFSPPVIVKDEEIEDDKQSIADIKLNECKSEAAYLKTIDSSTLQNRWTTYLKLKAKHKESPAFFIDMAAWFLVKNDRQTALLILSNVAEMKLEDAGLLRSMAYQLLDVQEKDLAIETFSGILKVREEEPQAYRDLALAFNEAGNYKEAIVQLYKLLTRVWDSRFEGIKSIALNEMNAIISAHPEVNVSAIDTRLIYAMPVDVRIIIDWNTNDSDIDLWVTDPKREKCFYQNKETGTGGHISNDMTQGYGPEEFTVKKAVTGNYIVKANLYGDTRQTISGPITIRADLYTNFGKPSQQRKTINFRVTDNKEVVRIGELKFN